MDKALIYVLAILLYALILVVFLSIYLAGLLTDPYVIEQRKADRRWERLSDEERAHYVESWREKWRA